MIKAIFFDWGGVLSEFRNMKQILDSENIAYQDNFSFKKYKQAFDKNILSTEEFLQETKLNITPKELKEIFKRSFHFKQDIINLIKNLNKDHYILSNNDKVSLEILREEHSEITSLFNEIFVSCELNLSKPEKEIYLEVLKKCNLKAEECIFIDDREENVQTAKNLGIKGIVFKDATQLKKELSEIL